MVWWTSGGVAMRIEHVGAVIAMVVASGMMAGCRVDSHKNGDNENVQIATPFGGMSVKTNGAVLTEGTGIDVYPGAQLIKKEKGHDDGAADVNMSFGKFSLRVKAVTYRTSDSPEKVLAFYKQGLTKFGTVIECSNDSPVGTPTKTADGLGCDKQKERHITVDSDLSSRSLELKTGSKQHQHIVSIDPDGSGTKIGLVALDLPSHLSLDNDSDKDDSEHKQ
jgi:hypothetical protein